jgi:phosphoglycolate phosphatase
MYDILLFDLDGTLTNSKEGITKCVQYALKHYGWPEEDPEKLTCFIGPPLTDQFQEYCGVSRQKALEITKKFRERYNTVGLWENALYPGIPEMLAALKEKGKRLAVATSKPEVTAKRILERFQVIEYFETVAGSDPETDRSTKSQVIEEALLRLGCRKKVLPTGECTEEWDTEHILMVGDRKHDVEGAAAFHMDCAGVLFGFAEEGELEQAGALFVADTVETLKNRLLQL